MACFVSCLSRAGSHCFLFMLFVIPDSCRLVVLLASVVFFPVLFFVLRVVSASFRFECFLPVVLFIFVILGSGVSLQYFCLV